MKIKKIIFFCIVLISCKSDTTKTFYPDGNLKSIAEMKNGILHGAYQSYYPSGELKSSGVYYQGKLHGTVEHFYESAKLEQREEWKNGVLDGYTEQYFENGQLAVKTFYQTGVHVGDRYIYYKSGQFSERQTFDSLGNLIYIFKRDQQGSKTISHALPIFRINRDTISVNDTLNISLNFGYEISGVLNLQIQEFGPNNLLKENTLTIDKFSSEILLRNIFEEPGQYRIKLITRHEPEVGDTISVDGWFKEINLFVTSERGLDKLY